MVCVCVCVVTRQCVTSDDIYVKLTKLFRALSDCETGTNSFIKVLQNYFFKHLLDICKDYVSTFITIGGQAEF